MNIPKDVGEHMGLNPENWHALLVVAETFSGWKDV